MSLFSAPDIILHLPASSHSQEAMDFRITKLILMLLASKAAATRLPRAGQEQVVLSQLHKGVGHFSEWSRETKREFLIDWQAGKEAEWTIVQGNEAGDLDSLTAALTWSYEISKSPLLF